MKDIERLLIEINEADQLCQKEWRSLGEFCDRFGTVIAAYRSFNDLLADADENDLQRLKKSFFAWNALLARLMKIFIFQTELEIRERKGIDAS